MLHSKQRTKLKTENSGGMFFPTTKISRSEQSHWWLMTSRLAPTSPCITDIRHLITKLYFAYLPAATKLGQGNVFTGVCDSVHGGCLPQCMLGYPTTPRSRHPPLSRHPLGADMPPGAGTPLEQTCPPRADMPPGADMPPPQSRHATPGSRHAPLSRHAPQTKYTPQD